MNGVHVWLETGDPGRTPAVEDGRKMHALVRGAAAVAVLTALGSLDRGRPAPAPVVMAPSAATGVDGLPALCGTGTLPEGPVCLRIPQEQNRRLGEPMARAAQAGDQIPRRPDRPADPASYRYPVGSAERAPRVLSGFEAGQVQDDGGVRLAAQPGEQVTLVGLEQQEGPAEVVFAGEREGQTVATLHRVREGERLRSYILIHGGLERLAPGVSVGAQLDPGATLGHAGVDMARGLITITLAARQLREGASLAALDKKRLTDAAISIPIDLRNVLPARGDMRADEPRP